MMIDIEALKKRHEREVEKAIQCNTWAGMLPVVPKSVMRSYDGTVMVSYPDTDIYGARCLMDRFVLYPYGFATLPSGSVVRPLEGINADEASLLIAVNDGAPDVHCETTTNSFTMGFFSEIEDVVFRIQVRVAPPPFMPYVTEVMEGRTRRYRKYVPTKGEVYRANWYAADTEVSCQYFWNDTEDFRAAVGL